MRLTYTAHADHFEVDEEDSTFVEESSHEVSEGSKRRLDAVPRRCTDSVWLVIFLLANGLLYYIAAFGTRNTTWKASVKKLRGKLRRWDGRICGGKAKAIRPPSSPRDLPYLFFCSRDPEGNFSELMFDFPLCLSSCPNSSLTRSLCVTNKTGSKEWLPDYPTVTLQGQLCFPVTTRLQDAWAGHVSWHYPQLYVGMVWKTRWVLVLVGGFSMTLSLIYMLFLNRCAGYFVWSTICTLGVVPWFITAYCAYCWKTGGCDILPISKYDHVWNAVIMGIISVSTTSIIYFESKAINNAVQVLQEACRCMFEARSLLVEPLVHLVVRVAIMCVFVGIFLRVMTGGWHHTDAGVVYSSYSHLEGVYMGYFIVMFAWHMQFVAATSSFVIMYVTWLWYFDEDDEEQERATCCLPWRGLFRAYWCVVRYHCGTLACAAMLLAITLPFRTILGPLTQCSYVEGNVVGCCLRQVCCCFIDLYERHFKAVDSAALMEVVLNSKSWSAASKSSLRIARLQESTVTFLNGVTKFFKLAGIAVTMYFGILIAHCRVQSQAKFMEVASPSFVMKPSFVYLVAALIAGVVAMPFHYAYDNVGNAILYCWTIQYHTQVVHEQQARSQRNCVTDIGNVIFCAPSLRPGHRP